MDDLCVDDNKKDTTVKSAEGFLSSDVSGVEDKLEDPEVVPRVGHEYQAEIPPLMTASYLSQLVKKPRDSEIMVHMPESFSLGLPLPLMWAHCSCGCGTSESTTSEEGHVISEDEYPKVKMDLQSALPGQGKNVGGFSNFKSCYEICETDIDSCPGLKAELNQRRGMYLLPGLLDDQCWTDIEYNSFLLGLYVFGKNLIFLKRFVGTKSMGDILSFYYGKFYRSKGYSRWSECRKMKTRKCIYGQKIFTGWRQQELLSRLFSHVPHCQTTLVEISKNFGEGKIPFEEYVFALKAAVGIDFFIAAVGIGKGKYDLTGTTVEPTKTNQIFSVRHEMPIGKACSSLTSADIIKFLTGNFRLSKARSSDLFWEAVWPRLLAKGWHSEEPKDSAVSGSKRSLVFLVPGVKKFSRRKLVKGDHYFDSISDVLNKVASDPGLLETEIQSTEGSTDKEIGQNKQNLDGVSNGQQSHSPQSHGSKCNQDLTKFTIVDTSMAHDMDQRKVIQMRSLPFQTMSISTISSCSRESERATSEDSEYQVEQAGASSPVKDQVEQANFSYHVDDQVENANSYNHVEKVSDMGVNADLLDCTRIPETLNTTKVEVENHKCHSDLHNDEHSREINEHPLIQKMSSDCTNRFPCTMKMQELRACNQVEFSHSTESTSVDRNFDLNIDLNEPISPSDLDEASQGMALSVGLENLPFPSYVDKGSPNMNNEGNVTENHQVREVSAENCETRMLIDLNFPLVAPDLTLEIEIPSPMVIQRNDDQSAYTLSSSSEITQLNLTREFPDGNKEQQSIAGNRRQSTRNRPLTTKALEALEYRFLNSKRKRKNTESSDNNSKSQCLHINNETNIGATCVNGIENSMADTRKEEENVIGAYSCGINLYRGSLS